MKKSVYLLAVAALCLGACQRQPEASRPVAAAKRTQPAQAPVAVATSNKKAAPAKAAELPASQLTPEMKDFLREHDLTKVWCVATAEGPVAYPNNGFFGAERYRIEMVFLEMHRDEQRPEVMYVRGKSRYKKIITPFEGTLTVSEIHNLKADPEILIREGNPAYSVVGRFELREDPTTKGAGVYRGHFGLDFQLDTDESLLLVDSGEQLAARAAGTLFEGEWISNKTGSRKPILWGQDFTAIGNEILEEFSVGMREVQINPRYAKLGWDSYWENDEWWVDAKVARL
ncbi:hypothetical protein [Solirubrum puertoriconensis]|uniref:Uncharacterized protein n=1 Tax=Solirubrum puertoriconensis TaxID=1751427 RepID=A0A9X0HMU8_SOLP1|nr:hypothetical protein [Solirubrum puertoriconensis]KUG08729.1 hypothetical protein ASU33_11360 [Solirubrum puertoriconensis]